jgi:hypothetical protein
MDGVACLYFAWLFSSHWRSGTAFDAMYEGLGAELPNATRLVLTHGVWLYPALFFAFSIGVVAKEHFLGDKRFSVMLTFFIALVAQFLAQVMLTAYYLPLFHIVGKLS